MLYNIDKVKSNKSLFENKVREIAKKLAINPNWLMVVMTAESGLDHTIENSIGCVGLIQFCPDVSKGDYKTINGKRVKLSYLKSISNVEQLDYVYDYYRNYAGRIDSVEDLYMITFFPVALNWNDSRVLQTSTLDADTIANANPAIDSFPKDKIITVGEFKKYVQSKLPSDYSDDETETPTETEKAIAYTKQPRNWFKIGILIVMIILLILVIKKFIK